MSREEFERFMDFVSKDKQLELKILNLKKSYKGNQEPLNERESLEFLRKNLIPLAQKNGFNFSTEDVHSLVNEIDEDSLKSVSGGGA